MSNIKKIYLTGFLRNMHFFGGVMVPMFMDWGGLSFPAVLLLQSWFNICIFAFEIPTGYVADRYGRKTSYVLGVFVGMIGFFTYTLKPELAYFVAGETLLALSSALISGADEALLYDTLLVQDLQSTADKVVGNYRRIQLSGSIPAIILGGFLGERFNLILPMQLTAFASCLAFLVSLTIAEISHNDVKATTKQRIHLMAGLKHLRETPVIRPYWIDFVIVNIIARSILWMYQPILGHIGVPLRYFGVVQATAMLIELLVISNMLHLDTVVGNRNKTLMLTRRLTMLGFLITCAGVYIGATHTGQLLAISGILITFGFGLSRRPFYTQIFNEHIPSAIRATTLSSISMFSSLGVVFVNPLTGILTSQSLACACGTYGTLLGVWDRLNQLMYRTKVE